VLDPVSQSVSMNTQRSRGQGSVSAVPGKSGLDVSLLELLQRLIQLNAAPVQLIHYRLQLVVHGRSCPPFAGFRFLTVRPPHRYA